MIFNNILINKIYKKLYKNLSIEQRVIKKEKLRKLFYHMRIYEECSKNNLILIQKNNKENINYDKNEFLNLKYLIDSIDEEEYWDDLI